VKAQPVRRKSNRAKAVFAVAVLTAAGLIAWFVTLLLTGAALSLTGDSSLGRAALDRVNELLALGPRPPGSEAHQKMERLIVGKLQAAGFPVDEDRFTADTPNGPVAMNNIVGRIPGRDGAAARTIILATHYDTKIESKFRFVGANDGGSGTGLLLALGPLVAKRGFRHNVWLIFLDGEEAFEQWTAEDSLYGSRHLAAQLKTKGTASNIGAFILLDMIGDRDLGILRDSNSTPWLRDLVWKVAARLGDSKYFLSAGTAMEDDHVPLVQAGVPSVDLIDFDYGKNNTYWHTAEDTADKLSAQSLGVVGEVALETIAELDKQ
jgi:Zn-dependent M28 family amino/carboxypeptidase